MGNCETGDSRNQNHQLVINKEGLVYGDSRKYSASESPTHKNIYYTKTSFDINDSVSNKQLKNLKNYETDVNDTNNDIASKITPSAITSSVMRSSKSTKQSKPKKDNKFRQFTFTNTDSYDHHTTINKRQYDMHTDDINRHTNKKKLINGHAQNVYSNANMIDIHEILSPDIMNINDPNHIIYEGSLLKYKPGTTYNWVERWCVINKKEFKYYKNKWSVGCWDIKPLHITPIKDIVATFRVILDLPSKNNVINKKSKEYKSELSTYNELYQYEIFTVDSQYPYLDDKLDEGVEIERLDDLDLDDYKGFQMWDKYLEQKKYIQPYRVNPNHLMRPPIREHRESHRQQQQQLTQQYDTTPTDMKNSFTSQRSSVEEKPYISPITSVITRDKSKFKENKSINNPIHNTCHHQHDSRGNPKTRTLAKSKNPERMPKVTYHWIKNKADLTSWTGREKEWYYSEKRLLFASPKIDDREKWLSVINWITQKVALEDSEETTIRHEEI